MQKIGLIAGNGQLPIIFSKKLLIKNISIFTIAFFEETNVNISKYSKKTKWIYVGQIKKLIDFFKKNQIKQVVMTGGIKKTKLFKNIRPDIKALLILSKSKNTHDDEIMRNFALFLKNSGIKIKSYKSFIPELIARKGILTKKKPSKKEYKNIKIGLNIARKIGNLDIGQTIIVSNGSVTAIEAIEGTDLTINRIGQLFYKKSVLIKICKPNQDKRFDLPTIGIKTIKKMYENNISTLVIKAKETIILNKKNVISKANKFKISILCI